jgi:hypothetical protein
LRTLREFSFAAGDCREPGTLCAIGKSKRPTPPRVGCASTHRRLAASQGFNAPVRFP